MMEVEIQIQKSNFEKKIASIKSDFDQFEKRLVDQGLLKKQEIQK